MKRRADIQRELELGKVPGIVDPATRLNDRTIPLGHRITGSVIESAEGGSYSISLEDAKSGAIVGTVTGGGKNIAELEASLRDTLRKLLDRLCPRAYTLKASTGPISRSTRRFVVSTNPFRSGRKAASRASRLSSRRNPTRTAPSRKAARPMVPSGKVADLYNHVERRSGRFVARIATPPARSRAGARTTTR